MLTTVAKPRGVRQGHVGHHGQTQGIAGGILATMAKAMGIAGPS